VIKTYQEISSLVRTTLSMEISRGSG
jgi:hypothetical protein